MPRVTRNTTIIEPRAKRVIKTILCFELERSDLLPGVLGVVPFDSEVFDGLFVEVLEELDAEGEGCGFFGVEAAEVGGEDVPGVGLFDHDWGEFFLFGADGEDAEFGYVGAVAVGALGVLGH